MKKLLHISFLSIIIPLLLLSACGSIDLSPATVKIAMLPYGSYLPFVIAQEEGFFAEQGITVELIPFTTTPDMTAALVSGLVDVGAGPVDVSSLNAISQGGGITFVADKGYLDPVGCSTSAWIVQNELMTSGQLDDLSNLAGMKAAFTLGTINEYAFDRLVEPYGLSSEDLEVLAVPAPTRLEALNNKSVDIVYLAEPWVTRALNTGTASILKTWESYMPEFQLSVVWYGPSLAQGNPDVGKRFMVAYLKAVRQYNEGKTDRNVQLMADYTQGSEEEVLQYCWQTIRSDGSIDLQSILDLQQWALENGYLLNALAENKFWDSQFIDYANDYLK